MIKIIEKSTIELSEEFVVVATDVGISKKARDFAARLSSPLAIIEKRRSDNSGNVELLNVIGDVKGKTALITGASKGIGAGLAKVLAAEGCNLHLSARDGTAMQVLADKLTSSFDISVKVHEADLSSSKSMHELDTAAGEYDILLNNAGDIPAGDIEEVSDEAIRKGFDLKVFGYITLSRSFMIRRKGKSGVIVNIIGNSGENWDAAYFAGSTGNAALMSLT